MDKRTQGLLAQKIRELDEGERASPSASAQPDILRDHLETWDRLSALRPIDPDRRDVAAGRERMFSALYANSSHRRAVSWVSVMSPLLRLTAAAAGILVLTGAAAGASVAVGGPPIWRTAGISRSADRAEVADHGPEAPETQATSESGSDVSEVGAEVTGPAEFRQRGVRRNR